MVGTQQQPLDPYQQAAVIGMPQVVPPQPLTPVGLPAPLLGAMTLANPPSTGQNNQPLQQQQVYPQAVTLQQLQLGLQQGGQTHQPPATLHVPGITPGLQPGFSPMNQYVPTITPGLQQTGYAPATPYATGNVPGFQPGILPASQPGIQPGFQPQQSLTHVGATP